MLTYHLCILYNQRKQFSSNCPTKRSFGYISRQKYSLTLTKCFEAIPGSIGLARSNRGAINNKSWITPQSSTVGVHR